jgi:hypothetical protein
VDNRFAIEACAGADPDITNCIFYNNTNGDLSGCDAQYSFVEDPITDGLVAHWKLDEGEGTTAYDSAGTNHGTLVNGPVWTSGQIAGALDFDGLNDYVNLGNDSSLKPPLPVTLSAWINMSDPDEPIQDDIILLDTLDGYNRYYGIWLIHGGGIIDTGYGDGGIAGQGSRRNKHTTAILDENNWYHVAAVIKGPTDMNVYLDAVDVGGTYQGTGGSLVYSNGNGTIGARQNDRAGAEYFFDGRIDDVRVYNRVLSAEEVGQLYVEGVGPRFVDAENGDYHLKSEGWSWSRSGWTWDEVTSPCIDSGNPGTPLRDEPESVPRDPDNIYGVNVRVNMGVYGGTIQASMPPHGWALLADLNNDGTVGTVDLAGQAQDWVSSARERPGDLNRDGLVNIADFALLADEWGQMTTWADMVNFSEYWPFAVGNQWDSEVIPDAGFTLEITDRFFVNGFEIWEFTNWFGTFYGGEMVTSYYVYVGGMLYATDSLLDLDSLPEISPGLRPQYREVIPVGGVVSIRGVGMTTVRRGDLAGVLEGTGFAVEDFPLGYRSDVIAFISLDGEHVIVFARGLGPMRINFSNDFCSSEFFIASATVVE